MSSKEEVIQFLKDFLFKLDYWGLYIRRDRINDKNGETLFILELKGHHVKEILKQLTAEDYSVGPLPDKLYQISDMWVFGKNIKTREVYIKIQLGKPNSETICISFHFAEHPMNYPFKK